MGSSGTASAAVSACTRSSSRSPTSRSSSRRCSTASSRAWTSAPARAAAPSWSARKVNARIELGARVLGIDLSHPVSVAVALDFRTSQPRHFGAPRASSRPFEAPGFLGSVERGASCNCEVLTLIPHCNGTHTECVGHLTREPLDAHRVVPAGLDRKSTRLNSSHMSISYAVFCLKKKKKTTEKRTQSKKKKNNTNK